MPEDKHTPIVDEFNKGLKHFYDCIDFGQSHLDAEAIVFMNEVPAKLCNSHAQREDVIVKLVAACEKALYNMQRNQAGGSFTQLELANMALLRAALAAAKETKP